MSSPSFCWLCRRDLAPHPRGGYHSRQMIIEGATRVLHVACAERYGVTTYRFTEHVWPTKVVLPDQDEVPQ